MGRSKIERAAWCFDSADRSLHQAHEVLQCRSSGGRVFRRWHFVVGLFVDGRRRKICSEDTRASSGRAKQAAFLRAWAGIGLAVPEVIETGTKKSHMLMQYVPAQTLDRAYSEQELIRNTSFVRMGKMIRCMHAVPAIGYGRPSSGLIGEYRSFESWLRESRQARGQLTQTRRRGLLSEEVHGSIDDAGHILIEHAMAYPHSSYCHWDFSPNNLLSTDPFTVIDPDPIFCTPYVDLGRSIIKTIGAGFTRFEVVDQIVSGYFADDPIGPKHQVLFAATLLAGYSIMPYLGDRGMAREATAVGEYLAAQNSAAR